MIERRSGLRTEIRSVAEKAIQSYARGILPVEWLEERITLEWALRREGDDEPPHTLLKRIAQRICSRELCKACCSCEPTVREMAFENMRDYLKSCLLHTSYARVLQTDEYAVEDVLYQTLETLHVALNGETCSWSIRRLRFSQVVPNDTDPPGACLCRKNAASAALHFS